jgi:dienelactone hydrolase
MTGERLAMRGRCLLPVLCAAFFPMRVWSENLNENRETFLSGGQKIEVEMFRPAGAERSPALLVLHGARGIEFGNGYVRQLAGLLATNGFATFLVHYFDRTSTAYADDATIYKNFELWLDTISDAVGFVAQQANVDRERIGCFGYSLGGYFALAQAARDARIRAVIEIAGGVDASYVDKFHRMPPTLVLHGSEDHRVPVANAREIERLTQKFDAPCEVKIYEGEGHRLSQLAMVDALGRGLAFLGKYLR